MEKNQFRRRYFYFSLDHEIIVNGYFTLWMNIDYSEASLGIDDAYGTINSNTKDVYQYNNIH